MERKPAVTGSTARSLVALATVAFGTSLAAQTIVAPDGTAGDRFGFGVSLSGPDLLVGAPGEDAQGDESGAAYLFERTTRDWSFVQKLLPPEVQSGDWFGRTVKVSGDLAAVSAPGPFTGALRPSAVYVYTRNAGVWSFEARLETPTGQTDDRFGWNLAIDRSWIFVGASRDDDGGADAGAVYAYQQNGAGNIVFRQKITLPQVGAGDFFGWDMAIDNKYAVVSAYADDDLGVNAGAVYVLRRVSGNWGFHQKLFGSLVEAEDNFGSSVAMSPLYVLAGTPGHDRAGLDSGTTFVFRKFGNTWRETVALTPADAVAGDAAGISVSIDGQTALVGASHSDPSGTSSGSAYVFEVSGSSAQEIGKLISFNGAPFDYLGLRVAMSGDHAVAGSFGSDDGGLGAGAVYHFDSAGFAQPWYELYCFCETAPCDNTGDLGGCLNSSGVGARLRPFGSPSVAADDLVLNVTGATPSSSGALVMGDTRSPIPFSGGSFCVGDQGRGLHAFPVQAIDATGYVGLGPFLAQSSTRLFPPSGHIVAGASWTFQFWYEDPLGVCGPDDVNATNAVEVMFRM